MKSFKVPYSKSNLPCTYKQIKYATALGLQTSLSISQLMKRVDRDDMSTYIDFLKKGEDVELIG